MTKDTDAHSNAGGGTESGAVSRTRKRNEQPSHSVIETVAEVTGTDPLNIQPLYDVIDPDALDELFRDRSNSARGLSKGRITFRYAGCDVTVHADGRTIVSRPEDARR